MFVLNNQYYQCWEKKFLSRLIGWLLGWLILEFFCQLVHKQLKSQFNYTFMDAFVRTTRRRKRKKSNQLKKMHSRGQQNANQNLFPLLLIIIIYFPTPTPTPLIIIFLTPDNLFFYLFLARRSYAFTRQQRKHLGRGLYFHEQLCPSGKMLVFNN